MISIKESYQKVLFEPVSEGGCDSGSTVWFFLF